MKYLAIILTFLLSCTTIKAYQVCFLVSEKHRGYVNIQECMQYLSDNWKCHKRLFLMEKWNYNNFCDAIFITFSGRGDEFRNWQRIVEDQGSILLEDVTIENIERFMMRNAHI